jgi:hypothetical protein
VSARVDQREYLNNVLENSRLTRASAWHAFCYFPDGIAFKPQSPIFFRETTMSTQISSKLAALAIALMMNSLIIGAVAYLFNGQIQQRSTVESLAGSNAPAAHEAISRRS